MKKITPIHLLRWAIFAFTLTISMLFANGGNVHADDNSLAQNSPWGLNDGMTQVFTSGGIGWGAQQGSSIYNPLLFKANSGSSPAYLWTNNNYSLDLMHDATMSYWIELGASNGLDPSTANDGLAFVINGGNQTTNGTNGKGIGGTSLGVWGDSTAYKPQETALQNSLAVEFDTYMNRDNYDTNAGQSVNYDIGAAYPGEAETYHYTGKGSKPQDNLNLQGVIPAVNNTVITGRWIHVTFTYKAPTTSTNNGSLTYAFDDEDSVTGESTATSANTASVNVDRTKLGNATTAKIGFASANKSSNANMVIVDTDSSLINATVSSKLMDTAPADGTGEKEVGNGGFVYGGDPLSYQYTVTNNNSTNAPNGLRGATIRTKLPPELNLSGYSNSDIIGKVTYGNNVHTSENITGASVDQATHTLEYQLSSSNPLQANQTATISINGTAENVFSDKLVSATNWRAFNGGLAQAGSNPSFTIKPGIITSTQGTIRNLTEVGQPLIANAHVFTGDDIGYTFKLDYDAKQSVIDWNGPIYATLTMPQLLEYKQDPGSATTVFHVTTTDDAGNVLFSKDYTSADIAAGQVAVTDAKGLTRNPVRNHITVTVTGEVSAKINGHQAIPAATAKFATAIHTDVATAPSFNVTGVNTTSDITLTPDTQTIDADQVGDAYEGEDYVNISGRFADSSVTNDDQVAIFAAVDGKDASGDVVQSGKHIQLTAGNTKRFNLAFTKPTISAQPYDGKVSPTQKGQLMDDANTPMLHMGVNTISLYAVDQNGHASVPLSVTVNVGLFKFMDATTDLKFPDTELSGASQDVNSSNNMVLTMNNSRQETDWSVTAKEERPLSAGKDQPVRLMYRDYSRQDSQDQSLAVATQIASSQSGLKADSQGNITLIDSNKDLHVNVNGGAVHNTYQTTVDWTLVNSVNTGN